MSTLKAKAEAILQEKEAKILPENIKKDVVAFGVTGELVECDTSDADATVGDILYNKTAYVDGEKLVGTMTNNGALNYTPSTSQQTIPAGYTSGGTISAVTSSVDANITQGNIKAGVTILGVTGNVQPDKPDQTKSCTPTISQQTIEPDTGYELASVTVGAVTSAIDSNIVSGNIKSGTTILGVNGSSTVVDTNDGDATAGDIASGKYAYVKGNKITGSMTVDTLVDNADPTQAQVIVDNNYNFVIINANSANNTKQIINPNTNISVATTFANAATSLGLTANKIKSGTTILGVSGSVVELNGETKTVTPTTSSQTITPTGTGKNALTEVTVNAVTSSIDANITAGNIKKDVSILGVTGTYEGSGGGGSGDVKLFETVEEMQQDPSPNEGDLAVVYRKELTGVTEESEFDSCIFPNTVVLDEAFSGSISGSFRGRSGGYFEGYVELSSSSFRFSGYGEIGEINIEYSSSDGITYVRTDSGEELQEFGTAIKYEPMGEPWNNVFGNFMKIDGKYFGGLYNYVTNVLNDNKFKLFDISTIDFTITKSTYWSISGISMNIYDKELDAEKIKNCIDKYLSEHTAPSFNQGSVYIGQDDEVYYIPNNLIGPAFDENKEYIGSFMFSQEATDVYLLDLDNGTYTLSTTIPTPTLYIKHDNYSKYYYTTQLKPKTTPINIYNSENYKISTSYCLLRITCGNSSNGAQNGVTRDLRVLEDKYIDAKTQLSATAEYVYEKEFYGKNGVDIGILNNGNIINDDIKNIYLDIANMFSNGLVLYDNIRFSYLDIDELPFNLDTSNVTRMNNTFSNCRNLITIPTINTSNVVDMNGMFSMCASLTTVPLLDTSNVTDMTCMFSGCSSLTTIPQLDTSNVTNMNNMFDMCPALVSLPQLNTSNVTNVYYLFHQCPNLSNESLNNILAMCIGATKITSNKTLNYIGLSQTQAQICTTLSNWSAFVSAGWSTGY